MQVYVSVAEEEDWALDQLQEWAEAVGYPAEFVGIVEKEPGEEYWQQDCIDLIKASDAVIVLVGLETQSSAGQRWEIGAIKEVVEKPRQAFYVAGTDRPRVVPEEMAGWVIEPGDWRHIREFLDDFKVG